MPQTTILQDAIRFLFVLINGSEQIKAYPEAYTSKLEGRTRIYAMQFWVCCSDFLAHEILNRCEDTQQARYLQIDIRIFAVAEPDFGSLPMIHYR